MDVRPGLIVAEINGRNAEKLFAHEAGGHRFQRVPPNEKRGRRHTSTVTVAVLPVPDDGAASIRESDIEWQATKGSGPGGQARNKTSNCVQMRHVPTDISVRVETERSQYLNREAAFRLLAARIAEAERMRTVSERTEQRRRQIGSGERSDKIRTYRVQDGVVTDHRTGKKARYERITRGHLEDLR